MGKGRNQLETQVRARQQKGQVRSIFEHVVKILSIDQAAAAEILHTSVSRHKAKTLKMQDWTCALESNRRIITDCLWPDATKSLLVPDVQMTQLHQSQAAGGADTLHKGHWEQPSMQYHACTPLACVFSGLCSWPGTLKTAPTSATHSSAKAPPWMMATTWTARN